MPVLVRGCSAQLCCRGAGSAIRESLSPACAGDVTVAQGSAQSGCSVPAPQGVWDAAAWEMQILTWAGPGALPPQDSYGSHDNGYVHLHTLPLITGTATATVFVGLFPSHQRTFQCSPPRTCSRPCMRSKSSVSPLPWSPWCGAAPQPLPIQGATGSCWHPESSITAAAFLRALWPAVALSPWPEDFSALCMASSLPLFCRRDTLPPRVCLPARAGGWRGGSGERTQKLTFHHVNEGQENASELVGAGRCVGAVPGSSCAKG